MTEAGGEKSLKRVSFEVTREVAMGEEIMIVGNISELGEWDYKQGVTLEWHPGHVWKGSVSVPAVSKLSYKFVKVPTDLTYAEWEERDDRTISLHEISSPGVSVTACWGEPESYHSTIPLQEDQFGVSGNGASPYESDGDSGPTFTARIAIQKQLLLGQHFKLVGSSSLLGNWDFRSAPAFTWTPDHVWQLELELPVDIPVDWKVVEAVEGCDDWCQWQSGENTIVDPMLLGLKEGDILEVGCTWDGESRATIAANPAAESAATVAAVAAVAEVATRAAGQRMITVQEEAVYATVGLDDESHSLAGPVVHKRAVADMEAEAKAAEIKAAAERATAERAAAEKAAEAKAAEETVAAEKAQAEKAQAEKAAEAKAALEKAERQEAEVKAAEAKAAEEEAAAEKAAAEKAQAEKAAEAKAALEKAERQEAEIKAAEAKAAKEEAAAEKAQAEKAAAKKAAESKAAEEKETAEKAAAELAEAEKEKMAAQALEDIYPVQASVAADKLNGVDQAEATAEVPGSQWPSAAATAAGVADDEDLGYMSDAEVVEALTAEAAEAAKATTAAQREAEVAEAAATAAEAAAIAAEQSLRARSGAAAAWPGAVDSGAVEPEQSEATQARRQAPQLPPFAQLAEHPAPAGPHTGGIETFDATPSNWPQTAEGEKADAEAEGEVASAAAEQAAAELPLQAESNAEPVVAAAESVAATAWPGVSNPKDVPEDALVDAPWVVRHPDAAGMPSLSSSRDVVIKRDENGAVVTDGLEDLVLTPEQVSALAEAGARSAAPASVVDEDGTFQLQKGRLDVSEDGSTVVVRGGHDYDSETGTVTVTAPLGHGPDGLLVDRDGKLVEEGTPVAEIADVKPEDEVGLLTKVGAYAGMAAVSLGAATLAGGIAVDITDVALIAGVYGIATAIGSSRNAAIRAKGAAGPVLSAFVTAADIARRIQGGGVASNDRTDAHDRLGKYEKSRRADVSAESETAVEMSEAAAAAEAEVDAAAALEAKVQARAGEMCKQLGPKGMQALEDGVKQVMSSDVQRILQALDSNLSDEDKVAHLVNMLLNDQPAACKTPESMKVEVRAAMYLAEKHTESALDGQPDAQHAAPVLLAALAMSAVDEMRGVKQS